MADGNTISPKLVRYPIIPLSYTNKNIAVPREMIIDYTYGRMYILKEDGSGYLRLSPGLDSFPGSIYHSINIGDGINSTYTINHNLGTEDVLVSIINISTKKNTLVDYTIVNANTITIDFGSVITVGSYRVIVCTPVSGSISSDSIYHSINIGDGINSVYTINHNLGTEDVLVSIINISTKKNTLVDYTIVDSNTITIDFGSVITVGSYRVIVCTPVSGSSGSASKYSINIGDGINSVYTINHNLTTEDVLVSIINISTKKNTLVDYTIVDSNTITIDFGSVIASNSYRVIVL